MKNTKRAVSISILLGYVLIACTFLSLKIEKAMMTQAVIYSLNAVTENTIPDSALFVDEYGKHLYYVEEGIGWETGLRVREFEEDLYSHNPHTHTIELSMYYNWEVIMAASRQPRVGEEIEIIENRSTVKDRFLLIYPNGTPDNLSTVTEAKLIAIGGNAAIVELDNAQTPFVEHETKNILAPYQQEGWQIYSLNDVMQLTDCFPSLAGALVMLLIPVALLFTLCILRKPSQAIGWINVTVSLILLFVALLVISPIEIPTSLLPTENILDLSHYAGQYSEVKCALLQLNQNDMVSSLEQLEKTAMWIVTAGSLLIVIGVGTEVIFQRMRARKENSTEQ